MAEGKVLEHPGDVTYEERKEAVGKALNHVMAVTGDFCVQDPYGYKNVALRRLQEAAWWAGTAFDAYERHMKEAADE